jgi:NADH-quinone oxidoreductase subunit H
VTIQLTEFSPYSVYNDPIGHYVVVVGAMVLFLFVLLTATAYVVYMERVLIGRIQLRPGPNRVGPYGLLQLAADGVKMAFKESFIPRDVDLFTYILAPVIAVTAAFMTWAVVPLAIWGNVSYWIANVNIGILVIFAISAMNVYSIMLAGYSSNSKYSLLGGLRAAAQLISYEMSLGLSLVPTFIIVGSLRLQDIANYSVHWGWYNGPIPLILLTPLGFVIYFISAVAETNRAPFDLPEAEQELVGGFHTEYSGFKFLLFYLAEYMNIIAVSAVATVLFLGAGAGPIFPGAVWFLAKIIFFLFVYIWIRSTWPRLRYDMLMFLGWKVLLPLALANVMVTAIVFVAVQ